MRQPLPAMQNSAEQNSPRPQTHAPWEMSSIVCARGDWNFSGLDLSRIPRAPSRFSI